MKFTYFPLNRYFHIILIVSAIIDDINKYNVNMAAFDHIFKQHINAKIGIMRVIANFLFFDNYSLILHRIMMKS